MCIGIPQILSYHMIFYDFWFGSYGQFCVLAPVLTPKNFEVDSHGQCLTEGAQNFWGSFVMNWNQSRV